MRSPDKAEETHLEAKTSPSPADPAYKEGGIDQADVGSTGTQPLPPIDSGGPRQ